MLRFCSSYPLLGFGLPTEKSFMADMAGKPLLDVIRVVSVRVALSLCALDGWAASLQQCTATWKLTNHCWFHCISPGKEYSFADTRYAESDISTLALEQYVVLARRPSSILESTLGY